MKVLEDALRLLVLYSEKQLSLRSSKTDYCPKEETAAIEATRTVKVTVRSFIPFVADCRVVDVQYNTCISLPESRLASLWTGALFLVGGGISAALTLTASEWVLAYFPPKAPRLRSGEKKLLAVGICRRLSCSVIWRQVFIGLSHVLH